ncbi:HK97 family phage prohead protease [Falsiroseomonas selenitidurans]|uniref:HK97 family phage prohead protease n=1 Tax=Falsiroseomonas selenitidurans TaxID=2716335 RepID=A0ABX1DZA5_9PROT|nr:HK97 family phage prohead protease [Falsiroseomonas selenitidurans]NKC30198.1 HK97 family phage prohead protease [Falsiroseomonas selenitidurans]
MELGSIGVAWEVKFSPDQAPGTFEGYASIFGNMDAAGDVVEPGAFAASLLERERKGQGLPPMYKMHGTPGGADPDPIGIWEHMAEDSTGLAVKGRLVGLDTDRGRWNLSMVKEGAMRGLSIGFRARSFKMGSGRIGEPRRHLRAVALKEVSLVDDPANHMARIYAMKSRWLDAAGMIDPRALEEELRRELKFSRSDAVKAIGIVKRHLRDAGEDQPDTDLRDEGAAAAWLGALKRRAATLKA